MMTTQFAPLTPDNWQDFEQLLGKNGGAGGCWCMYWRRTRAEFEANKGANNHDAMQSIVEVGNPVGILAYVDGQVAGWCALAPREDYPRLLISKVAKPVDEQPVWSIVCLFIAKPYRQQGLSTTLIQEALRYAIELGAIIIEAYPIDNNAEGMMPDVFAWTGIASAFRKAGFIEASFLQTPHTADDCTVRAMSRLN